MHFHLPIIVTHHKQNTRQNNHNDAAEALDRTNKVLLIKSYFVLEGLLCCLVFSHHSRRSGSIGEAAEL